MPYLYGQHVFDRTTRPFIGDEMTTRDHAVHLGWWYETLLFE